MRRLVAGFVIWIGLVSCSNATGPRPLTVTSRQFSPVPAGWPETPVFDGGSQLLIRGTIDLGCGGTLSPSAARRANAVAVVLDVKGGGGECAAAPIVADIVGYALTVSGLTEGTYRIRLTTTGSLPADTATVSIAPMPLAQ